MIIIIIERIGMRKISIGLQILIKNKIQSSIPKELNLTQPSLLSPLHPQTNAPLLQSSSLHSKFPHKELRTSSFTLPFGFNLPFPFLSLSLSLSSLKSNNNPILSRLYITIHPLFFFSLFSNPFVIFFHCIFLFTFLLQFAWWVSISVFEIHPIFLLNKWGEKKKKKRKKT